MYIGREVFLISFLVSLLLGKRAKSSYCISIDECNIVKFKHNIYEILFLTTYA